MFGLFKNFAKAGSISASEWIKKNPELGEEILVYPETQVKYNDPKTIDNNVHPTFISKDEKIPAFYVRSFKNGKCYTRYGNVLTSDNKGLQDYTTHEEFPLKNKRGYKFNNPEKFNGKVALLSVDPLNTNYFHWMIEVFPRLHLLEKAGINCDKYIISCSKSFQKELLEYLGIKLSKCIDYMPNKLIQAEELIVPDMINNSIKYETKNGFYYNAKYLPRWVCSFYEGLIQSKINKTKSQKIYISREKAKHRKIQNEDELVTLLEKFGFKRYFLEDVPIKEQLELFGNADTIIAPHGAGLTNLLFCPETTKVIELFPENYLCNNLQIIAKAKELDYFYLTCEHSINSEKKFDWALFDNLIVDISRLEQLLKQVLIN